MKVLFVSHTYIINENQKKISEIAKLGVDIHLIVPRKWLNRDIGYEVKYRDNEIGDKEFKVSTVNSRFARYGSLIFYPLFKMIKIIKEFNPDIIHLEEEPWSLAALEFTLLAGYFKKKLLIFTWENLDRKLFLPLRLIRKFVLKHVDFIIGGNHDAIEIVKKYGFKKDYQVIPQLGIDAEHFSLKQVNTYCNPIFVIGFVGRLVPQKGVRVLIDALSIINKDNVKLIFVGTGPMEEEIIELSRRNNLYNRIEILRYIKHENIPNELHKMDVLVLPSITTNFWKEQFGHVLIEAMSCGVPVIGSTCGEIPNVIFDCGLIFKEGDAKDLAEKITLLMENKELYEKLRIAGRQKVINEYTHEKIAERTVAIYRKLIHV